MIFVILAKYKLLTIYKIYIYIYIYTHTHMLCICWYGQYTLFPCYQNRYPRLHTPINYRKRNLLVSNAVPCHQVIRMKGVDLWLRVRIVDVTLTRK